jgi:hypothetical protein
MAAPPTPLTPLPFVSFTLTLPNNTVVVEADPAPFNNTKELLFLNLDTTNRVFVRIVDSGNPSALPADVDVNLGNSMVIPANGSAHLCICSEGGRVSIRTTAEWNDPAIGPGSQFILVFKAENGADVMVNVTYVQNIGGADGRGCGGC